jgi:hypothetical protein
LQKTLARSFVAGILKKASSGLNKRKTPRPVFTVRGLDPWRLYIRAHLGIERSLDRACVKLKAP